MAEQTAEALYTLTQVSDQTGISMPTLQRYKKLYQDRIPSKGKGRSQRYPEEALDVFRELKKENIGRRGRPRKTEAAKSARKSRSTSSPKTRRTTKKAAAKAPAKETEAANDKSELLTLTQIGKLTGISYPTLLRYVKTNLEEIPHKGTGRARRFLPEAVDVFKKLRGESRRGRQPSKAKASDSATKKTAAKTKAKAPARRSRKSKAADAGATATVPAEVFDRLKALERANKDLIKTIAKLEKAINKPFRVTLKR